MDGFHTVGQSLEKSLSPSAWSVGCDLLIRLLVGFRKEAHIQVVRCRIFTYRDPEFDGLVSFTFVDRIKVQLCELFRRFCLREGLFPHVVLQNPKSTGIVATPFKMCNNCPPNLRVLQNAARCKFQSQMLGCPMEDVKCSCQMTRLLSYPMMDLVSRSLVIG